MQRTLMTPQAMVVKTPSSSTPATAAEALMTALVAFMATQPQPACAESSRPTSSTSAATLEFAPKEASLRDKCQGGAHGNLTYQELLDTQLQYVSWVLKASKDAYPGNWGVATKQLAFNLQRVARINEEGLEETMTAVRTRQLGFPPDQQKVAAAIATLLSESEDTLLTVGRNAVQAGNLRAVGIMEAALKMRRIADAEIEQMHQTLQSEMS